MWPSCRGAPQPQLIIPPEIALDEMGVDPFSITDIIITHQHWDHAGNLDRFPPARFDVQEREMASIFLRASSETCG